MARIQTRIWIDASPEKCFDLARSQQAHVASAGNTDERIVDGPKHDLLELGDHLTFHARHFGTRQRFTSEIVRFERPDVFVDEMRAGPFRSFRHEHVFRVSTDGTEMIDKVEFSAPLGPLGRLAERLFITGHIRRFLVRRARTLRAMAERRTTG